MLCCVLCCAVFCCCAPYCGLTPVGGCCAVCAASHYGIPLGGTGDDEEIGSDVLHDRDPLYDDRKALEYDFIAQLDPYSHGVRCLYVRMYCVLMFLFHTAPRPFSPIRWKSFRVRRR
jgi:hypothetical protein